MMKKYTTSAALLLATLFLVSAIPAHATAGFASSSNVLVLNSEGTPAGIGYAGDFPDSAVTSAGYTVTYMAAASVTGASSFSGYDTIVLWMYCSVGSDTTVQSALISFLQTGGKIIVWDSDACNTEEGTGADYSWLSGVGASFAVSTPGETGSSGGSLTIKEADNFLTGLIQANLDTLVTDTDAVGDLNAVTSSSPAWCAITLGTNIESQSGFAEAYTAPGGLTGATGAMIVYAGYDTDYIGTTGGIASGDQILVTLVLNTLAHGWGNSAYTSDLTCSVPLSGIHLDPTTATNAVGGSHTVTATVTDSTGAPLSGVIVSFQVTSGPNAGATGTATTGTSGTATFTYSDTVAGTDSIVATFTDGAGLHTSNTVEKIWTTTTGLATTTTTTSSSTVTVAPGTSVTDIATVAASAGTPTGTVQFYFCGPTATATPCTSTSNPDGSAVTLVSGSATSAAESPTTAGYYCWAAVYTPDTGGFTGSSSTTTTSECFQVVSTTPTGVPQFGLPSTAMAALGFVAILSLLALKGRKQQFP